MRKVLLIINPVAGRGMYKQGLGEALNILYTGGYQPTVMFTAKRGDAVRLAADNAENFDVVACVGGDGTLSEVVTGLMLVADPPPIGYFPLGTANDVATTLKLPKNDLAAAARLIVVGTPMAWDVGALGDHDYFTYVAAFGAFTDVSYETSQQSKQALGQLAYLLEGASRLPRLPHYKTRVELDGGRVFEGDYIFGGVTNSLSVAGMVKLNSSVVGLDDGVFEISLVKYPANFAELNLLMAEITTGEYNGDYFTVTSSSSAKFTFTQTVPWTRDGENGGAYREVSVRNCHDAARIIV